MSFVAKHGLETTPLDEPVSLLGETVHEHATSTTMKSTTSTSVLREDNKAHFSGLAQAKYDNDMFKNAKICFKASRFPDVHFEATYYDTAKQNGNYIDYIEGPYVPLSNGNLREKALFRLVQEGLKQHLERH